MIGVLKVHIKPCICICRRPWSNAGWWTPCLAEQTMQHSHLARIARQSWCTSIWDRTPHRNCSAANEWCPQFGIFNFLTNSDANYLTIKVFPTIGGVQRLGHVFRAILRSQATLKEKDWRQTSEACGFGEPYRILNLQWRWGVFLNSLRILDPPMEGFEPV